MTEVQASIGMSIGRPLAMMPTLLITTSTRPKPDIVASPRPVTSRSLVTSHSTPTALPPRSVISTATAAARWASLSATAIAQPRSANVRAVARPMPLPAPVMTATAPPNDRIGVSGPSATGRDGLGPRPWSRPHRSGTPRARRSTTAASAWARRETAAVITSAEPWKVPGELVQLDRHAGLEQPQRVGDPLVAERVVLGRGHVRRRQAREVRRPAPAPRTKARRRTRRGRPR